MDTAVSVVVLAAGQGTRMKSAQQKVLHSVYEKPMLLHVLDALASASLPDPVVVTGFGGETVEAMLDARSVRFVSQPVQSGSADALRAALPCVSEASVLVVYGCEVMLTKEAVEAVLQIGGKDCVRIANRGVFRFTADMLRRILSGDEADLETIVNALDIAVLPESLLGGACIRDRVDLACCESAMRARRLNALMRGGVTILDPSRVMIGPDVEIGTDTVIYPDVTLLGSTKIGSGVTLLPGCYLKDTTVGDGCTFVYVHANEAVVGNRVSIGPYVNLRPKSVIADGVKIGDFVEIKNSNVGEGTKVPHLTYVGDADVGARVNIGCGSVFVNYNGFKKSRTVVGDDVFLGCQTNLVAPVYVGDGAFTAAGSTITEDIPAGNLSVARARQVNKEGWVARYRKLNGK